VKRKAFGIGILAQYPKALRRTREVARAHGYAIGLHGSRTYDLDLIAAPWVEQCSTPEELAIAIASDLKWFLHPKRTAKPHGRMGFLIYGSKHAHIDLSVMGMVK
jgi:hypothetical protein